jgi:membrane-bound ClpP family serine protease
MVGKEVKVEKWQGTNGIVFIYGELWKATSDGPLLLGDKAIIEKVDGLLLRVKPRNDD